MAHYGIHVSMLWVKIIKRSFKIFLEKEECEAEITTELLFFDLIKFNSEAAIYYISLQMNSIRESSIKNRTH